MSRFEATEFTDQRVPQEVEISYCIENLVADKLVFVSETVLIKDPVVVQHNRVIKTAALDEVSRS